MKLVTFNSGAREHRIGAVAPNGSIVDLNTAYALYLRNVEQEGAFYALADARVPADMRGLFENGDRGLDAARAALEHALKEGPETKGPNGEPVFFRREAGCIKAPVIPKKIFHTAGKFRGDQTAAQKGGVSHPVLPWVVVFLHFDDLVCAD